MRFVPHAITILRIVLSFTLPLLVHTPPAFAAVCLLAGLSDAADGYLARKFKLASPLGARLDSLADFIFFSTTLLLLGPTMATPPVLALIIFIAVIRLANLATTRRRFGQWNAMHTWGNKLSGLLLFLSIPAIALLGAVPWQLAFFVGAVSVAAAVEERVLLHARKEYDPNRRSLFPLHRKT